MKWMMRVRFCWTSRTLAVGVHSHNKWREVYRGFTVYLLVVAVVFTRYKGDT